MEQVMASIPDFENAEVEIREDKTEEVEQFKCRIDEIFQKVDELEQRVNEVEQFYLNTSKKQQSSSKGSSAGKERDKERHVPSIKKQHQDASRREAAAAKRMQELMRQFGTILRQITQHKWAWPFMQPVDVKGLGLHDYYEIIEKPMDFSTIKNQMEAKDGTGYKNVRDIRADVRLVFDNAMKYNDEGSDVHLMAKTLLEKFEEKWQLFLPKVTEEEKRRDEEEAEARLDMQLVREAAHAKLVRDLSNELYEVDTHLEKLRETVVQKCSNPAFQAMAEEVEIDIDAQSESTLWRLNFFVKDALESRGRSKSKSRGGNNNNKNDKRKKEMCDATAKAKAANKKSKKTSS
ncbi:hypothetical protein V6N12_062265 [Hibiscus sabdariffa]|uniref:Bromo domain-containing protein n=1 Tax=Hibiscus sabdariffa TaxID=183260 RepID=A0ABR2F8D7_9ROSI